MQEEEPDEPHEPDCDEVEYSGGDATAARANRDATATTCTTEARIKRVLDAKAEHGLPKMLRLGEKAKPQNTNYPDTPLVNKVEQKRLKAIESEAAKKKQTNERAAAAEAVVAIVQQPELTHEVNHPAGAAEGTRHKPHESHDMRTFTTSTAAIIYCDHCGKWQRHDAGRSKLAGECQEIKEGSKSGRKLLRHKIIPEKGAVLPVSVKTKGGKRC